MLKTLYTLLQKFLHTFKSPVLFINTSYQVDLHNYNVTQQTSLLEQQKTDEQLTHIGTSFINSVKNELADYRKLKYKLIKSSKEIPNHFSPMKTYLKSKSLNDVQQENNTKEKFYSMFNDIVNGIIFINKDGIIVEMNEAALKFLQCEKKHIIDKNHEAIFDLVNDYNMGKTQYLCSLKNNNQASINVSLKNKMDDKIYLKIESKFNNTLNLFIMTIIDETETILLKEQVEQQESLKTIGQMAANIAHEIRNPMTSLKGFVQLLKVNSSDENQGYLRVIDSELERMESILTEILELSKPNEGVSENFTILRLERVVQEVIELMTPLTSQSNIRIEFKTNNFTNELISGHKNRLKQLLINLIKNAIEVMPNGGTIIIKLDSTSEGVQLYVVDDGPGISKEEIECLFKPFYTTKDSGTGLGLPLVKKIVEQHNGSIQVLSSVGIGTTFRVNFPIVENEYRGIQENLIDGWIDEGDVNSLPVL